MEKISIIVPVYNVEPYIHKCVDSILAQTYSNIEVILVDDGSPDNCGIICDEYAEKDDRVVVIHKENGGLSDARNAGIDKATGEYIGFVDSDDYIAPDMYEKLYKSLKENNAEIAVCNVVKVIDDTYDYSSVQSDTVMSGRDFLFNPPPNVHWTVAWNKLYIKNIFNNLRYPKGRLYEDTFVIHKVMLHTKCVVCLSDRLYYYVNRSGSIMNTKIVIKNMVDRAESFFQRASYYISENCPNFLIFSCLTSGLYYAVTEYSKCRKQEGAKEKYKELVKVYRTNFSFNILRGVPVKKVLRACISYIFPYPTEKTIEFLKKQKRLRSEKNG